MALFVKCIAYVWNNSQFMLVIDIHVLLNYTLQDLHPVYVYFVYTRTLLSVWKKMMFLGVFWFVFLRINIIAVKQDCKITQLERGT